MKTPKERLKLRMRKDRPMAAISIRIPEDVVDELKDIAPLLGFSGYQPLIRNYIGQGLRKDASMLYNSSTDAIAESLRKQGVEEEMIQKALRDAGLIPAVKANPEFAETA
jgi:hypothetical protein